MPARSVPARPPTRMTPLRSVTLLALTLLAAACGGEGGPPGAGPGEHPNVLLVSIDTLRADHLEAYGYERRTAPALAALAEQGALFEDVVAVANWTLPTHASLFTGMTPRLHGVETKNDALAEGLPTIVDRFEEAGYRTAGVYSNPFLDAKFGWARAFDEYVHVKPGGYERAGEPIGSKIGDRPRPPGLREEDYFVDVTSPEVLELGLDVLRRHEAAGDEAPFFLFLHFNDVHSDYIPPEPFDWRHDPDYEGTLRAERYPTNPDIHRGMDPRDLEHVRALYDGEISWVDRHVGRVLEALDAMGARDDTLVVVTSDHGEGFYERRWKEHHYGLYRELLHVPWIVRWPGRIAPGTRIERLVSQADIPPTILDLAGLEPLPTADGVSRADWLTGAPAGGGPPPHAVSASYLYTESPQTTVDTFSLRTEDLAVTYRKRGEDGPARFEVYDRRADPLEQHPLPPGDPRYERALSLLAQARDEIARRKEALPGPGDLADDPEFLERMEQMGYIGRTDEQ